jgi:hypothetical protein
MIQGAPIAIDETQWSVEVAVRSMLILNSSNLDAGICLE